MRQILNESPIQITTYFVYNNYILSIFFFSGKKKLSFYKPNIFFQNQEQKEDIPSSRIYREKAIH